MTENYEIGVRIRAYDGLTPAMTTSLNSTNAATAAINRLQDACRTGVREPTIAPAMDETSNAADSAAESMRRVAENAGRVTVETNDSKTAINGAADSMRRVAENAGRATGEIRDGRAAINGASSALSVFSAGISSVYFLTQEIGWVWNRISNTISNALSYSDTVTQTLARINIAGDTENTAEDIMSAAYSAAERSRSDYLATADAVSKLMVRAPDAFNGSAEVIQFTENLNKLFKIAGATAEEQNSATLQLTQALGSGVLRGEEFNAVFEAAPNIMRTIADSMDVPIGSLREMAANGEITADIVKNALLGATDSINEQFGNIPRTWESTVTSLRTTAERAFQRMQASINRALNIDSFDRILDSVSNGVMMAANAAGQIVDTLADGLDRIAKSDGFTTFAADITTALSGVMTLAGGFITTMATGAEIIIKNWNKLRYPLLAVGGVLTAITAGFAALRVVELASATTTALNTAGMTLYALATGRASAALVGAIGEQTALNFAMYACPVTWIVLGIMAVVAVLYIAVGAYNELTGSAVSATGIILGTMAALGAGIYNQIAMIYNYFAGFSEMLMNWRHPIYAVEKFIAGFVDFAVNQFSFVAEAIDKIAGTDISNQMNAIAERMNAHIVATMPDDYKTVSKIEYANIANEFNNGYAMGRDVSAADIVEMAGLDLDIGGVESQLSKIEANTASAALSLDMSKDEIGYMRDVSDNRTIANNSVSSVKIDMTNNNSISNGYQADAFVSSIVDQISAAYKTSNRRTHA